MLSFSANQQGIELQAEIENLQHLNLIQWVLGDQRRYLQIILNFLSNSLKFTNKNGSIRIVVKVLDHQQISTRKQKMAHRKKWST